MSANKVFIFPGQGAQQVGMGKEFYEEGGWVDSIWKEANDILGYDLKTKVFNGTEDELKITKVTQPAVFMTEIIMYMALLKKDIRPSAAAGHSLGEYTAIVASGAMNWRQGLELVKFRGEIFDNVSLTKPGGMIAVIGMEEEKLLEIANSIDGICEIVNYNSPDQLVVSVEKHLFKEAVSKIKEGGAKIVVPLKVSVGFHSSLLNDAVEPMKRKIEEIDFKHPDVSFYANYSGEKIEYSEGIKEALIRQVNSPVRWNLIVNNIVKELDEPEFLEVGPGKVLQGLVKRIARGIDVKGISTPEDIEKLLIYD